MPAANRKKALLIIKGHNIELMIKPEGVVILCVLLVALPWYWNGTRLGRCVCVCGGGTSMNVAFLI